MFFKGVTMKKLFTSLLAAVLILSLFAATASAAGTPDFSKMSDKEVQELYDAVRREMVGRGLPLAQDITLKAGKFIIGDVTGSTRSGRLRVLCRKYL